MPGIDKLNEILLKDAEEKAAENLRKARERAAAIIEEATCLAQEDRENRLGNARREAERLKERIIAMEVLESGKRKLKAKQEVIDSAFMAAIDKLESLPDHEYRNTIIRMVLPLVREGNNEIVLSARDKKRLAGIEDDINRRLAESRSKGTVSLSGDTGSFTGGFIIRRGKVEINATFEVLAKVLRPELESEVAGVLFG